MLAPPPVIRRGAVRKLRRSFAITRIQVQDQRSCRLSQACIQVYKGGVSPSKSDLVRAVTELDVAAHLRPAAYDIVFLEYRVVRYEFLQDHRQEVRCYPVSFFLVAIPPQSRDGDHLHRGPSEWSVPLVAGLTGARLQPSRLFEYTEVGHNPSGLAAAGDACPERVK